jgi:hypothetical protein
MDTVILEPQQSQAMLLWRASVPLDKKFDALRAIRVGAQEKRSRVGQVDARSGKPRFEGMDAAIQWLRKPGGRS